MGLILVVPSLLAMEASRLVRSFICRRLCCIVLIGDLHADCISEITTVP